MAAGCYSINTLTKEMVLVSETPKTTTNQLLYWRKGNSRWISQYVISSSADPLQIFRQPAVTPVICTSPAGKILAPFWRHDSPNMISHQTQTSTLGVSPHSDAGQQWSVAFILFIMWQHLVLIWEGLPLMKTRYCDVVNKCVQNDICNFQTAFQFILSSPWQNMRDYHQRSASYFQGFNVHEPQN